MTRICILPEDGDWVVVPKSALDWLNGSAAGPDGKWFAAPEGVDVARRPYWWRAEFRKQIEAARPPVEGVEVTEETLTDLIWSDLRCARSSAELTAEHIFALLTGKQKERG